MFDLKRIFAPVDFSAGSRAALSLTRVLRQRGQVAVEVVHATAPPSRAVRRALFPYAAMGEDEVPLLDELRRSTSDALVRYHKLNGEDADVYDVRVLPIDADKPAADTLTQALAESDAEIVCAGHSGESGARAGVLGTTIERLVASSTRPVLLAQPAGTRGRIDRVTVALDLSPYSATVYASALALAVTTRASLEVLVVIPDPTATDVSGIVSAKIDIDHKKLQSKGRRELDKRLQRFGEELQIPFSTREGRDQMEEKHTVLVGDPAATILNHLAESDSQIVVLGRRGAGMVRLPLPIGRTARAVLAATPCHALVVPPRAERPTPRT